MDSDSQKSPRPQFRFGFHGRRKAVRRNLSVEAEATPDDILDSLTRQAGIRERLLTRGKTGTEEIFGSEALDYSANFPMEPAAPPRAGQERSLGRLAFAFMLIVGLSLTGLYEFLTRTPDLSLLNRLIGYSGVQTIFAQPLRAGVIAATALLAGLWIARKRKRAIVRL